MSLMLPPLPLFPMPHIPISLPTYTLHQLLPFIPHNPGLLLPPPN